MKKSIDFGKYFRWTIIFIFIIVLLLSVFICKTNIIVHAATLDTGITGLTATYDSGWSRSGTTITGSVTSTSSSGCSGTTYTQKSGEITFTNSLTEPKILSFTYAETNLGSVSFNDGATTKPSNNSTFSVTLSPNGTLKIKVTSHASNDNETKVTLSNVQFNSIPEHDVHTTFNAPSNGSYTVDGQPITQNTTITKLSNESYSAAATANQNYYFTGWYINNSFYSKENNIVLTLIEDSTVEARFSLDPLFSIAVLSGGSAGETVGDYVSINSSNYHSSQHSYHTDTNVGGPKDSVLTTYVDDPSWSVSGSTIVSTTSGKATGDEASGLERSWTTVKIFSDVIRINALRDCKIAFKDTFNNTNMSVEESIPTTAFYTYVSSTALSGNIATTVMNSGVRHEPGESVNISVSAGSYLYILSYGAEHGSSYASTRSVNYTYKSIISDVTITAENTRYDIDVTYQDNTGITLASGKIKIGDTVLNIGTGGKPSTTYNNVGGSSLALSVNAVPTNYVFIGWIDETKNVTSYTSTYTVTLNESRVIKAIFAPAMTITAGGDNGFSSATYQYKNVSNTTVTASGQYVARNTNATAYYSTLSEAFSATNVVVLLAGDTLNGDFTIPSGKTLVVPCGMLDKGPTTPALTDASGNPSHYAVVTLNGSIAINGNLVVSATQSYTAQGKPVGPVGRINMSDSSSMTVAGKLYAFGCIYGGSITALNGAEVHELMSIGDMANAVQMYYIDGQLKSNKVFPFSNYFIRNIEAPVVYNVGSKLIADVAVKPSVAESYCQTTMPVIGSSSSMFILSSGTITKSYDRTKDQTIISIDEGATVSTGSFSLTITLQAPMIGSQTVTMNTANYYLPLCSAFGIDVNGTFTLNNYYKLLPGASLNVGSTGSMTISSGSELVLYRMNDYDVSADYKFSVGGCPVNSYRFPSPSTYNAHTAANTGSAKLNVDGVLTVNGGLYVTNSVSTHNTGSYPYSNGYNVLTGTGQINMTNSSSSTTAIYEARFVPDSNDVESTTVSIVSIKGLTNFDATTDDGQTGYTSLTKDVWYGFINNSGKNVWSLVYTVSFDMKGFGIQIPSVVVPRGRTFTAPTAPTDDNANFKGWFKETGCTNQWNFATDTVNGNIILYAKWAQLFTIVFVDEDGTTVLQAATQYEEGTLASAIVQPSTPTKAETAQYTYTFAGWSPTLANVTADATYIATYNATIRTYTVTIVSNDYSYGQVNSSNSPIVVSGVEYNSVITINDNVLTLKTINYTAQPNTSGPGVYAFDSWSASNNDVVTGDLTITATFSLALNQYTVTIISNNYSWGKVNDSATSIVINNVVEGSEITVSNNVMTLNAVNYTASPTTSNAQYTYAFVSWSVTNGDTITDDITITATFSQTLNQYTISFVNYDNTVLQSGLVAYGTTPVYTGSTPERSQTAEYTYTFAGWDSPVVVVTEAATYTATFNPVARTYAINYTLNGGVHSGEYASTYTFSTSEQNKNIGTATKDGSMGSVSASVGTISDTLLTIPANTTGDITVTWIWKIIVNKPAADSTVYTYNGLEQTYQIASNSGYVVTNDKRTSAGSQNVIVTLNSGYIWNDGTEAALSDYVFTINKAALTVTANNNTITYGAAPSANGCTITGFVNSETESVLTGSVTYSYNYSQYGNVGNYNIIPAGLSSDNYNISYVNGTLTVNPKEVGITWGETGLVYTGSAQAPTATPTGLVNSDTATITVIGAQTNVGSYTATASNISNSNYVLPSANTTTFTISFRITFASGNHGSGSIADALIQVNYYTITGSYTPEDGYEFTGWSITSGTATLNGNELTNISDNLTITATWSIQTFTITWRMDDNSLINTTTVEYGVVPTHANPSKASTAQYNYTFTNWTPEIVAATADATYTAVFSQTTRSYTITWRMDDNSLIDTTTVEYGVVPTHGDPSKASTAQYDYSFTSWTPTVVTVTGEATYTAVFSQTTRSYTITWLMDDNSLIDTTTVAYGVVPTHADASKASTAQYEYTFANWTPTVVAVTGEATYTAVFNTVTRTYTITWVNYDDTVLETDSAVPYGTVPTYDGATPTKPATAEFTYIYNGWDPTVVEVSGNATYTAIFSSSRNAYLISFVNYNGDVLQSSEVLYGVTPTYSGETPTKPATDAYTFVFNSWDPTIVAVTGVATYTATFTQTTRTYPIHFVYGNKTLDTTFTLVDNFVFPLGSNSAFSGTSEANTVKKWTHNTLSHQEPGDSLQLTTAYNDVTFNAFVGGFYDIGVNRYYIEPTGSTFTSSMVHGLYKIKTYDGSSIKIHYFDETTGILHTDSSIYEFSGDNNYYNIASGYVDSIEGLIKNSSNNYYYVSDKNYLLKSGYNYLNNFNSIGDFKNGYYSFSSGMITRVNVNGDSTKLNKTYIDSNVLYYDGIKVPYGLYKDNQNKLHYALYNGALVNSESVYIVAEKANSYLAYVGYLCKFNSYKMYNPYRREDITNEG